MNRKIYYWKLRTTEFQLGERTLVMGVLNVTPDSFSDGGRYLDPDKAYARALEMEEEGVDLIDIGAESTRPESKRISADEEWQRLVPVLKRLRGNLSVPLSLDTYKSEVAERALEYGVEILNDPSGLTFDANLAKVAVAGNTGLILNHMRGTPETWGGLPPLPDVMGSVSKDLDATTSRARRSGVEKNRIVIDPGLGFGKRKEQNSEILAQLGRLAELDYPVLVAASRKGFLTHPGDGGEVLFSTAAAVTAAVLHGAHIVRVHDVKEMRAVVLMADEIARLGAAAVQVDAEAEARKSGARTFGTRPARALPSYLAEEKRPPMRPPIQRPAVTAVAPPVASPVMTPPAEASGEPVAAGDGTEKPLVTAESLAEGAKEAITAAPSAPKPASAEAQPVEVKAVEAAAPVVVLRRPPQTAPSKGWGPPPRQDFGDRPARPPYRAAAGTGKDYGDRPPRPAFGDRGPRKDFGDRPPRPAFGDRGPRKDFGDRPPRPAFGDRGPRKDFGDRPPRPAFGDRGPRKDFGDRPPRPAFGDRGPRNDFGDRPPRPAFEDRDPRKDYGDRPQRPAFEDRGPRKDYGDRPSRPPFAGGGPKKDYGDRPSRPPFAGGGPKKDFGDRGPRKDFGDRPPRPPFSDRGPKKDFGDRGPRPPFADRGAGPATGDRPSRPPFGGPKKDFGGRPSQRPFRKRP